MKLIKTTMYTTLITLLLSSSVLADCSYELFSISSTKNTKIIDFVEQLSDECDFSIIISDSHAEEFLNTKLQKTNLNNLTIDEVFNIVLKENNLSYTLENNILKISYLNTKMFSIDYILSQRKGESNTDITLSSEGAGTTRAVATTTTTDGNSKGGGGAGKSGMKIESTDEVVFWNQLDLELQRVLNRPQDKYKAEAPIINKNAGIVTVTATVKQMDRLEGYLKNLQDKVQLQVLIDVQLLSVTMSKGKTTGVDWKQLYALQDINIEFGASAGQRSGVKQDDSFITLSSASGVHLNEVIKFLKTQGDVTSISNPKVLTLNNQPALITAGVEYFYKITSTETLAGATSGTQSSSEDVQSVFAGVLLDITPEISDDKTITLKINPSLSEAISTTFIATGAADRTMPPDLSRRQLSSVVTVKDGNRIILGGLITTLDSIDVNKVPILGDIPILNYLFKYENKVRTVTELVIVIEPHIINKEKDTLSLSDLGYTNISKDQLSNTKKKEADEI
ncbi:pilus (MSHA type) biogenesis protein MshL [Candidatus Sulfurimonas baltica]|uniref:Pilus (MSHA type) biogenesis protein MshL n=1 Tax=Candidatus Sulfurimonas baltica TaxID=2740404 RepID=A0A7S7LXR7_9BACT|nr:pilus (MSHA type) biogenesis protein MshL [Candidatus Sulfurimonas baltica]QOY52818.1 pilus (MSHA type) biogenesis protein MshL [Candidatus Sulfurimonas baltica]